MSVQSITPSQFGAGLRRSVPGFLVLASLAGCGTHVDGLGVSWQDNAASPVLAASDPGQCPEMTGVYVTQGRVIESSVKPASPANLHTLLAGPLAVRGFELAVDGAWESASTARVSWARAKEGWSIRSDDSQGTTAEGRIRVPGAEPDTQEPSSERVTRGIGPVRSTGCSTGRLWVTSTNTWTQYESMSTARYVAVLRPEQGGLHVSLLSEHRSIGLLPWWSSNTVTAQYWFDRAPAIP